jgi:hypothetical protein
VHLSIMIFSLNDSVETLSAGFPQLHARLAIQAGGATVRECPDSHGDATPHPFTQLSLPGSREQ